MASSTWVGVVSIIVCILMYGSSYVPVKKYKTYDGVLFQWYTASGTVVVGVIVGILFDWGNDEGITVPWEGIVSGILYSIIAVFFPLVVKLTGLALGYVLWCGTALIVGWAISRFGWWGLDAETAKYPALDYLAIIICSIALIMMMFIKPDTVSVKPSSQKKKIMKPSHIPPSNIGNDPTQYSRIISDNDNENEISKEISQDENDKSSTLSTATSYMWPESSQERRTTRRRRLSMEMMQSSSLIPSAYLFGTWLDFDQLAKDKYFEYKLRKKYNNNDIIGVTNKSNKSYGSTSLLKKTKSNETNTPVDLKTIKSHNINDPDFDEQDEQEILINEYHKMKTNYQWLKPIIHGQFNCGPTARRIFGIGLALMEGVVAAHAYVPYLYWQQNHDNDINNNALYVLNYVFSYTIGIYLGSTFFFSIMGIYKRCKNLFWPKPVVRPAFSSGCMYGLGYAAFLLSTAYVSYPVCYVGALIGSIVISNLWSLIYFSEITSKPSIIILSVSLILMIMGIIFETVAD